MIMKAIGGVTGIGAMSIMNRASRLRKHLIRADLVSVIELAETKEREKEGLSYKFSASSRNH
jgi:hypothetical protein